MRDFEERLEKVELGCSKLKKKIVGRCEEKKGEVESKEREEVNMSKGEMRDEIEIEKEKKGEDERKKIERVEGIGDIVVREDLK